MTGNITNSTRQVEPGDGFETFVTIVDSGSVTAAAEMLGLPRSTLSRRLARLETRLGVRLLHRTTRRMTLTAHGEVLYETARRVVDAARAAEAEVLRLGGVPRGLLRASVPTGMPQELLARWVIGFLHAYPEVSVELVASSVHVDLVGEGFDVAIRAGAIEDPSLIVRTLGHDARVAVASARYLAERGAPEHPAELQNHSCIVGFRTGSVPERRWPLRDGGWVAVSGSLMSNQMGVRLQAARQHFGIALVVDRLAAIDLANGTLITVLPEVLGRRERLSLVYPNRTLLDPGVRVFVDYFAACINAARAG